ncbi:acyltransferase-domain-containing protein [Radiomyces spectabilis]|uniref:acyltransferase-domain-containing protein n=1 Tax=Radiomyces spectabilis TaxID=64574 RepID=UPI00221ECA6A|nr:acyltransferase-domain-containing protein [Radiomyces spectabilis]KAI8368292.1 acyltransferase-domain-containing protein [Radiomyces spectabilis]
MTSTQWTWPSIFKAFAVVAGLIVQSTCVVLVQLLSLLILPFSAKAYRRYIAHTMRMWSLNLVALVQFLAPSDLVVTFDESCVDDSKATVDTAIDVEKLVQRNHKGEVTGFNFPNRIIVTANHQIYADWIYIWCVAYMASAHGAMKIILKDSLKSLPIFGWGMQFFDFIFLKRKLAVDQKTIVDNLKHSSKSGDPLWLVLFPEGTVISTCTRERSRQFAEKNKMEDNRYTLLPRATGLRLSTLTLDESVEWLYDFTIGYSGIPSEANPEDVYTIQGIFFFGHRPKNVHIHIRRFRVSELPKDMDAFSSWIYQRWIEKDELMAYFYKHGKFPSGADHTSASSELQVPIRLTHSVVDLIQPWIALLPYIPIIKWTWQLFDKLGQSFSFSPSSSSIVA